MTSFTLCMYFKLFVMYIDFKINFLFVADHTSINSSCTNMGFYCLNYPSDVAIFGEDLVQLLGQLMLEFLNHLSSQVTRILLLHGYLGHSCWKYKSHYCQFCHYLVIQIPCPIPRQAQGHLVSLIGPFDWRSTHKPAIL